METFDLRAKTFENEDYININDLQKLLDSYAGRVGYVYSFVIIKNLIKILEEAKMPAICADCKKESYCMYPVGDNKENKFVCDKCYDEKYRCKDCKETDRKVCDFCENK